MRNAPASACLAGLLCALLLTGCVYPVYKTLQPEARLVVEDAAGTPLSKVQVSLIASTYPYGREKSSETQLTDARGVATFPSRREWRAETLMIHGAEVYFWNWCVEKPGYETVRTHNSADGTMPAIRKIVVHPGVSQPCAKVSLNSLPRALPGP